MGRFIHLLHTLQGALGDLEGNFLVNSKGDFIIDHNKNFIELYEKGPEPPPPPMGDPHVSVIGDIETNSEYYVPTYNYYCYSLTQQIYTAAEIDFEGYITGIVFYPRGSCSDRVFSVFLSSISKTSFTDYNSVVVSQDDIVLTNKTVTVAADTPIWLQFDTPYYYSGEENLLVTVKDDTGSYDSSIYFDIMYTGNLYQALYIYQDSAPYLPTTQNYMGQLSYKNAIQLLFNNAEPEEPIPDLPTENYFMLTNRGNDTNIEINSANGGNVFINDVYVGKTGNTYSIPASAVIKITKLRATGSYEHSSIYTTDTNANLSVDRWDESIVGDPLHIFSGQSGIRSVNSWYGAQNYTGLSYTFYGSTVETVDNWSNLTYLNKMDRTFIASQLRSIPSRWYGLDGVRILDYAFSDTKLTSLPTSWDGLNNAESMRCTFFNCTSLTAIPESWTSLENVTNVSDMFAECTNIVNGATSDVDSLISISNVSNMFKNCSSWTGDAYSLYEHFLDLNITPTLVFSNCTQSVRWNEIPDVWGGGYILNPLGLPANTMRIQLYSTTLDPASSGWKGTWTRVEGTDDTWDMTYNSTNWSNLFDGRCSYLQKILGANTSNVTNMQNLFRGGTRIESIIPFDTSKVTNMERMFSSCYKIETIPVFPTGRVTTMARMFEACLDLLTIPLLDTRNVTNMAYMFSQCYALTTIPLFNTSSVTNMSHMFEKSSALITIPLLNTSNVTDMEYMFSECTALETIPLINPHNVTTMKYMFYTCKALTTIPALDASSVTNMYGMFCRCYVLTDVAMTQAGSATDMRQMFAQCYELVNAPALDTHSAIQMGGMFWACKLLANVPLYNTSNVTDLSNVFAGCQQLATVPCFDTHNVTNIGGMFSECYSLTTLPLFNTSNVTNMSGFCGECKSLTAIPLFNTSKVTTIDSAFSYCYNVQSGMLALYMQASSQANPPASHVATFYSCGSNTESGRQQLDAIPSDWKSWS